MRRYFKNNSSCSSKLLSIDVTFATCTACGCKRTVRPADGISDVVSFSVGWREIATNCVTNWCVCRQRTNERANEQRNKSNIHHPDACTTRRNTDITPPSAVKIQLPVTKLPYDKYRKRFCRTGVLWPLDKTSYDNTNFCNKTPPKNYWNNPCNKPLHDNNKNSFRLYPIRFVRGGGCRTGALLQLDQTTTTQY